MDSQPQFRADLSERALAEILFTIYRHRVPGLVVARKQSLTKKVYIQEGEVVYATSSDLNDSLGAYLRHTGRLSVDDFREVMEQRRTSRRRLGEILVDSDLLSPAEIYEAVKEQVEAVVWSLFAWSEGEVSFEIGDLVPSGMIRIGLPMRQVILEGIQRAPVSQAKALASRLGGKNTVFEPSYQVDDLIEVALGRDPTQLLRLVDGERTLLEVCSSGPGSTIDNAKLVYGFHVLGMIRRQGESSPEAGPGSEKRSTIKFKTGSDRQTT